MSRTVLAWHFLKAPHRGKHWPQLPHGDRRSVRPGVTLTVAPPIVLCRHGLHASLRVADALRYAPGPFLSRVRLSGEIVRPPRGISRDKLAASERTALVVFDATRILYEFALGCVRHELKAAIRRRIAVPPEVLALVDTHARRVGGLATLGDVILAYGAVRDLYSDPDKARALQRDSVARAIRSCSADPVYAARVVMGEVYRIPSRRTRAVYADRLERMVREEVKRIEREERAKRKRKPAARRVAP